MKQIIGLLFIIPTLSNTIEADEKCMCYNETVYESSSENKTVICECSGMFTKDTFDHIAEKVNILTITNSDVQTIKANTFAKFEDTLMEFTLTNMKNLEVIEKGTFNKCLQLHALCVSYAPLLRNISLAILEADSDKLKVLRVTKTGLTEIPKIKVKKDHILDMVDFEGNKLSVLRSNGIEISAYQVIFDYNSIETVEGWAFNNSNISQLSLKGNRKLRSISVDAFLGLEHLSILDLSETSITSIPVAGIGNVEVLIIRNTPTLKKIPSIYEVKRLKKADLTHPFHCCAFELPERHDPHGYAERKLQEQQIASACKHYNSFDDVPTSDLTASNGITRANNSTENEIWHNINTSLENTEDSLNFTEEFHQQPSDVSNFKNQMALCGLIYMKRDPVVCTPRPNAFNPCEDVFSFKWLRICVWFVVVTALFGNLCVLAVILNKGKKMNVQCLLIANLAFSDLCMAVFLLMIAVQDVISRSYYFNYAFDWQEGLGCKIAGFVTIFASQLSTYVLCLLTIERWFSIKKALYVTKLDFHTTLTITAYGWLYAIFMAILPLFGISSYSKTSLCLPMKTDTVVDVIYILLLLFFAIIAFVIICVCYGQIYFSLSYETRRTEGEYRLARKMAILVGTNFVCLAPITFFALTAVAGYPLIGIRHSKILLVFFYPINSCADPFLYAIMTSSFKSDLVRLLSRFGIRTKSDKEYRLIPPANQNGRSPALQNAGEIKS